MVVNQSRTTYVGQSTHSFLTIIARKVHGVLFGAFFFSFLRPPWPLQIFGLASLFTLFQPHKHLQYALQHWRCLYSFYTRFRLDPHGVLVHDVVRCRLDQNNCSFAQPKLYIYIYVRVCGERVIICMTRHMQEFTNIQIIRGKYSQYAVLVNSLELI